MCLTLDISEKVTDHSKSKDSNGDTERGREKNFFISDGNKNETVIWEGPQRFAQQIWKLASAQKLHWKIDSGFINTNQILEVTMMSFNRWSTTFKKKKKQSIVYSYK